MIFIKGQTAWNKGNDEIKECKGCKKKYIANTLYQKKRKYCNKKCYWDHLKGRRLSKSTCIKMGLSRSGEKNYAWKGGRAKTSHGYIRIKVDGHPLADCNGYVYEHRFMVEQRIGRYLKPNEEVHHINGRKDDNRSENIAGPINRGEHMLARKYFKNKWGKYLNKNHKEPKEWIKK